MLVLAKVDVLGEVVVVEVSCTVVVLPVVKVVVDLLMCNSISSVPCPRFCTCYPNVHSDNHF